MSTKNTKHDVKNTFDADNKSWKNIKQRSKLSKKQKQEKYLKNLDLKELQAEKIITNNPIPTIKSKEKCELSTISIAVQGSILSNAQSQELRTYLAGQIARAACIFRVDEVIVFDDAPSIESTKLPGKPSISHSCTQLARILQYLECPQYLRKFFFPIHNDLKYSGLLNPLDAPHHLRTQNTFMYREGIVTEKRVKDSKQGCYVNVGLYNDVLVDKTLMPGLRVTVKINDFSTLMDDNEDDMKKVKKKLKGTVVSPNEPRIETGIYWGYTVRIAECLSDVFTKCTYKGGYDLIIGTSDKGTNIHDIEDYTMKYNHALVIFGGLKGLEAVIENDEKLEVKEPLLLFDHYLNVLPMQGSRTIRTEEAILISLAALQEKLSPIHKDVPFKLKDFIPQSEDTGKKLM